jgi:hypothetical protein
VTTGEAAARGERVPPTYVARFQRMGPAVMVLAGTALVAGSLTGMSDAVHRGHHGRAPQLFAVAIVSVAMIGAGVTRLLRGRSSGWIAFAVDTEGVHFGAQRHEEPRRFAWDEVSALVIFSRRTEFARGTVRCLGVRLHPAAPGSPENHLAELGRALRRTDLELHEWKRLRALNAGPSEHQIEVAVSFHIEARGWGYTRSRLKDAMLAHAPGVPVITATADGYYDLVGWRADQDELREVLENADLRHWC